ncbi:MAG: fused MFS/spermidine synthase [Anaerolineae bacterium]|nr:fused MFS/spermidine synthase [Anaerolineae bacterium]
MTEPSGLRTQLLITTFLGGLISLALELAAGRLLAPAFGTTELVWSAIIGLILLYMSVGYAVGGRWADRAPNPATLYTLLAAAGIAIAVIPLAARPLLTLAAQGMLSFNLGLLAGPFVVILALFAVPVILLACVSPFAVRLAVGDVAKSGRTIGWFSAVSTLGSVIGTFLPNLVLIPNLGTRRTFLLLAMLALSTGLWGLWRAARRRFWALAWTLLVLLGLFLSQPGAIKPLPDDPGTFLSTATLIHEAESAYNFIQVIEDGSGRRYLLLNEGQGVHSIYTPPVLYTQEGDPLALLTGGPWDFYLVAPFFNPAPHAPEKLDNALVIGLAAGTTPTQLTEVYGPIPIDGVEIDGEVVALGREYFGLTQANVKAHIMDGRTYLLQTDTCYDLVAVDAYRLPYIPWHLTTVEFFREVRDHLTGDGVVAINVGYTPGSNGGGNWQLVDAMVNTMRQVFPSTHIIAIPNSFNAIVVATVQPSVPGNLAANLPLLVDARLQTLAQQAVANLRIPDASTHIFTDDRAPVEQMTHALALQYALGRR